MKNHHGLNLLLPAALTIYLILNTTAPAARAQNSDPSQGLSGSGNAGGQGFLDDKGDLFMEEVTPDKPKKPIPRVPIDLSRVGVSVDPSGRIVPIKDNPDDPWAGSGVKPFQNTITNTFQPIYQPIYSPIYSPFSPFAPYGYGYPGGFPGGYGPGYNGFGYPGYNGFGYPGYNSFGYPGYNGFGYPGYNSFGYPGYNGFGYPGYNGFGYPGYNGYGPYYQPGLTFNIGKFQATVGSVPPPGTGFGFPAYAGPPNFSYPGFNAILPNNTTYTQSGSSMWRAFNLAF